MKLTKLTLLTISLIFLGYIISAENKSINKDIFPHFDSDITNPKLKSELKNLTNDFKNRTQKIRDKYQVDIDALKEKRRLEIQSIKDEYSEKRGALYLKYDEKNKTTNSPNNPNKLKRKKIIKKSKKL